MEKEEKKKEAHMIVHYWNVRMQEDVMRIYLSVEGPKKTTHNDEQGTSIVQIV